MNTDNIANPEEEVKNTSVTPEDASEVFDELTFEETNVDGLEIPEGWSDVFVSIDADASKPHILRFVWSIKTGYSYWGEYCQKEIRFETEESAQEWTTIDPLRKTWAKYPEKIRPFWFVPVFFQKDKNSTPKMRLLQVKQIWLMQAIKSVWLNLAEQWVKMSQVKILASKSWEWKNTTYSLNTSVWVTELTKEEREQIVKFLNENEFYKNPYNFETMLEVSAEEMEKMELNNKEKENL